jgi:hypothetical protein
MDIIGAIRFAKFEARYSNGFLGGAKSDYFNIRIIER